MSRPRNNGSRCRDLAAVPVGRNRHLAAFGIQPAFDGMIASACDLGIRLEDFIEMARLAKTKDAGIARFLDAWDTLSVSEQQARGAADAVCEQLGLAPVEILRVVADVGYRFAMCIVKMQAAIALPSIVLRSVESALSDEGIADRKMLFQHSGFLPTAKTAQTVLSVTQNVQAAVSAETPVVIAPSPERTIRRLADAFNEARGLPRTAVTPLPERASCQSFRAAIPKDEECDAK
jgi:hypothetical protein